MPECPLSGRYTGGMKGGGGGMWWRPGMGR